MGFKILRTRSFGSPCLFLLETKKTVIVFVPRAEIYALGEIEMSPALDNR